MSQTTFLYACLYTLTIRKIKLFVAGIKACRAWRCAIEYISVYSRDEILPFFFLILICFLGGLPQALAQDALPAVPPVEVEAEILPAPELQAEDVEAAFEALEKEKEDPPEAAAEKQIVAVPVGENTPSPIVAPIVVELFSSQACVFCPKADALLAELSRQENLIALDCHVDYFDVKTGALSLPFCSSRQSMYEASLRAGPKYTPQMVINGRYNAVGYRRDEALKALERAAKDHIVPAKIVPVADSTLFELQLASLEDGDGPETMKIWLIVFDQPHEIKVAEGGNSGKDIVYEHIVSNAGLLGEWDGSQHSVHFDAKLSEQAKGFAVLVQDQKTGRIVAASQYLL